MSIEWLLYFIDILGNITWVLFLLTIIFLVLVFLSCPESDLIKEIMDKGLPLPCRLYILPALLIFFFILWSISLIFTPSKQTMYAIALAHYSKQSDIPEKVLKAIEVKLDEVIKNVDK